MDIEAGFAVKNDLFLPSYYSNGDEISKFTSILDSEYLGNRAYYVTPNYELCSKSCNPEDDEFDLKKIDIS